MTVLHHVAVLESRCPKSTHWQGHAPPKAYNENPSLFLPASGGSKHSLPCGSVTHISASTCLSFCIFISCVFSYKDTC
ncbi:PREDICTED: small EDRK-rich factor 1-like [Elephantulus edwardii]|uniref:small EDRK-rich factor 1-like n=1 Tax=Elephantulus edwardii TaxID=28737 RepID=UPI0003F05DE0|nr:PREDICTED: small EDRK-rich factor 1-like [Elephantulus edwardii]